MNLSQHSAMPPSRRSLPCRMSDRLQSEDTDAGPDAADSAYLLRRKTDTLTQEFRAAGAVSRRTLKWLGGLYYFHNKVDGHYLLDLTNLGFVFFDANYTREVQVLGGVQVSSSLSSRPQLSLIAGLRYGERGRRW